MYIYINPTVSPLLLLRWCLGILVFEMLCGYPPFSADSQMDIYHQIIRGTYKTPPGMIWRLQDIANTNFVWCMGYTTGVGWGSCIAQRSCNSITIM